MQKLRLAALALAVAGLAGSAHAQIISQAADIIVDTTWGDDETEIVLELPIFVRAGATLTILPGTIVRGQPRTGPVVPGSTLGTPGALIISQNGKLIAGGAEDNPIIMTTAAVDNNNDGIADDVAPADGFEDEYQVGTGDIFLDDTPKTAPLAPLNKAGNANVALWGGLAILGRAPTNLDDFCGEVGKCTVEGLTIPGFPPAQATYGGVESHDSSGRIQYVSVRHAGDEIGDANELNGITLAGVGDGTILEFAEVYANWDDGIEWFGGTISSNNLVVEFVGDDNFDADQGYTGVNQFLFGVMPFFNENDGESFGYLSGDKACEFDGDDFNEPTINVNLVGPDSIALAGVQPAPWPLSHAIFNNMTIIGSTPDSGEPATIDDFTPVSPASANRGCQMRNGFAGELRNSVVVNTGTAQGYDVDTGGAPGYETAQNIGADYDADGLGDLIRVYCNTFNDGAALPATELSALANGDGLAVTALDNNTVNSAAYGNLIEEDTSFDPTGNAAGKLAASLNGANGVLNPRPPVGVGTVGCGGPSEPGTDGTASYRGAFIRTAARIWTTDWTVFSIAGMIAD